MYKNVYNNEYNCRFPKQIRKEGAYYKVNDTDITLTCTKGTYFYTIKGKSIIVMTDAEVYRLLNPEAALDISSMKIFDAGECVICLSEASSIVFLPCAHRCVCCRCNIGLKTAKYCCPVCREPIKQEICLVDYDMFHFFISQKNE
jgi:hypothetical protein